ncbi:hypothetical protein KAW18_13665 [candidate division WOR-3 bacterium]|nr:hypothetical protein [candidate division WOR-3 bacterium]
MGASEMIAKGKAKYIAGINRIGVDKYTSCGALGGMKTAVCLKEAKAKTASAETWGATWAKAMA